MPKGYKYGYRTHKVNSSSANRVIVKNSNDLAEKFETITVNNGEGALGRVWLTVMPLITGDHESDYNPELDSLSSMLAIPVIENGRLKAIVSFLF